VTLSGSNSAESGTAHHVAVVQLPAGSCSATVVSFTVNAALALAVCLHGHGPHGACLVQAAWCSTQCVVASMLLRCAVLCRDDTTARRLTLLWVANNSMSVDLCASVAFSEQYLVFGVEGGSECWAGAFAGILFLFQRQRQRLCNCCSGSIHSPAVCAVATDNQLADAHTATMFLACCGVPVSDSLPFQHFGS
jgi:hypothetical protein